jgi:RecB family exonuclease
MKVTNSEIETWRTCKRRWWYKYWHLRALPEKAPVGALTLGSAVHMGLENYYRDGTDPVALVANYYLEAADHWPEAKVELANESSLAQTMLDGYLDWVAETGVDAGLRVTGVETVVEMPLRPGITLRGKLDQVVQREDGAHMFLDFKTAPQVTPPPHLQIMSQFRVYALLRAGTMDSWTDGAYYQILKKVKRSVTAKPPFFTRYEVRWSASEMRAAWAHVLSTVDEIASARRQLEAGADHHYVVPPHPTRDCGWRCEFLPICKMTDDSSRWQDALADRYRQIDPDERYSHDIKETPSDGLR